jgi:hypothetical protein
MTPHAESLFDAQYTKVITEEFVRAVQETKFQPTVLAADRHETMVWEAVARDTLNRYVTLGITPYDEAPPGSALDASYLAEVNQAADDGQRFSTAIVHKWEMHTPEEALDALHKYRFFYSAVHDAARYAMELTKDDLKELYLVPHVRGPR